MRKTYFLFATAAMIIAACNSKDSLDTGQNPNQPIAAGTVGFDAYTQRATSNTRSGETGVITIDKLKETTSKGFGVFGYYTDNNEYEQSRIPDFMYNQQVKWDADNSYWKYDPVKYWPNEYGSSANSDDNDKVSFFAYAPYVDVQPSIGKVVKEFSNDDQWGITALSRNSASGDPLVKYIANFEADKRVDLLWGVCDDPQWMVVQGGTVQNINDGVRGLPWLNVERPKLADTQQQSSQRLKFTFKHALAQFSVNIDAFVDGLNANNPLDSKTKIYVRQISFTGFAMKGALNLNNTDPNKALWLDYNGAADIESGAAVTIYDGRKDGKEGTAGADATNEKQRGLNPDIISNFDDASMKGNTTEGVTNVTKPLFASGSPAMVIPTGEDMEVEIVYDVETEDENLSTNLSDGKTKGSSIENRITKTVSFGPDGMQNGKHYTLSLHLGMNSVKFDAAVSPWEEFSDKPEADLPLNMPSFLASSSPIEQDITLAADVKNYQFAVYGLTPGETVNVTLGAATTSGSVLDGKTFNLSTVGDFASSTAGTGVVNSSGVVYIKINEDISNNTVHNKAKDTYLSVKGVDSNKEVRISFEQVAHKLGLGMSGLTGETTFNLTSAATGLSWASDITPASVVVTKNSVGLTNTGASAPSASGEFQYTASGTIVLYDNVAAGDVYAITIKAGDADTETWNAKIGGISISPNSGSLTYHSGTDYYAAIPFTYVFESVPTVTWSDGSAGYATVNTATGKLTTTKGGGSETITATVTNLDDTETGWYFTATTKTANYTLTINKQTAVISFPSATLTKSTTDLATPTAWQVASPVASPDATTGAITYTITSTGTGTYSVGPTDGVVTATSQTAGDTFTVTATSAANDQFTASSLVSYTVTVNP
ncbi:MAG: fimbrillin family protein [Prevotella sp.]|nr:fimbrillin family protein [Prevotella sp.]